MIFSEDRNSFSLCAAPTKSLEQLTNGLWLALVGVDDIPPHIALISEGKYYSLSAKKVDCGTPIERFANTIERKRIPSLFIKINKKDNATSRLDSIYKDLQPLSNTENTCLYPIKEFFTASYSPDFANSNYVFELLALLEKHNQIKECVSFFCEGANANIITLPKYTMIQIKNKIHALSSEINPPKNKTHAAI